MHTHEKKPKIVVIGGGTGVFTVLSGLRKYPVDLTAVVSMTDDGGSAGVLREEFGILPPGDVRRVLVALSHSDELLAELFNYRFEQGGLKGHAFGNIMLTALERITGSFENAIREAARILGVRGEVLPVTLDNVRLCAELEDGSVIQGETNIDIPKHDPALKITRVYLNRPANVNPQVRRAILDADLVVIGPGDLYTSVIPNLLVRGLNQAIKKSKAKKVYVVNIMTKWGETNNFTAAEFVRVLEKYVGEDILDYVLVHNRRPPAERLRKYEKQSSQFVIPGSLPKRPKPVFGDFLRRHGFIRHDPERLAEALMKL